MLRFTVLELLMPYLALALVLCNIIFYLYYFFN